MIISPGAYKVVYVAMFLYMRELARGYKTKPSACWRRVLYILYSTINICSALV